MATPLQVETLCPRNTCPVCLNKLRRCELGKPEGCRHYFCLSCILEWSKVSYCKLYTFVLLDIETVNINDSYFFMHLLMFYDLS